MTKDEKISIVLRNNGAFWAFGEKQFKEQAKDGVKYANMGAGLICPKENTDKLMIEMDQVVKEVKDEEKKKEIKEIYDSNMMKL